MDKDRLTYLFDRYLTKEYSNAERAEFIKALQDETNAQWLEQYNKDIQDLPYTQTTLDEVTTQSILDSIMVVIRKTPNENKAPVHRIHFLRTAWFRYAAAILIVLGVGAYLYITNQKEKPSVTQNNPVPVQNDVAPGGNRATLTLADESKIILDSAQNGTIANEGTVTISKQGNQIIYASPVSRIPSAVTYNIMSTPRGGQYQLTLPDGSQVWLNAESSITYPTAFISNERKVTITGEAYFEVAKDKTRKFIVNVNNKATVEVLGTHFNVNAYNDEPTISTTLLEGSVKFMPLASRLTTKERSVLTLKPGQQGQLSDQKLSLASNPNINQVMAWKTGQFDFQNVQLEVALRQIARWYDVEIVYTSEIPKITLGGGLGRDLKLSQVLKMLEGVDVKTRIENKKLYISQ